MEGDRAEVARIVIGHANSIGIHTGNILNWTMLKKHRFHPSMTSSDELMDGLHSAVHCWMKNIVVDPLNIPEPQSVVNVSNTEHSAPIDLDQRERLKLSVKLFLCDWRPEFIRQAIDKILLSLGVKKIDSLIVSFPIVPTSSNILETNNNNVSPLAREINKIKPVWKALQSAVDNELVKQIGVCDFDQEALEALGEWAQIKPSINQINLTNCCAVPSDLIQYSRDSNIDLLTHNDPPEILSAHKFQSFIAESTDDIASNWTPSFIARYAVLVRLRGIVHSKGYIVSAERQRSSGGEDYGFF